MIAARIHQWGGDPLLEEVANPAPRPGHTVVEIAAASVAHIDLTVATGAFVHVPPLPYVPGTEGAGRVLHSTRHPRGARVRVRGGGVGLTRDGTWAEQVSVPDAAVHPIDDAVDFLAAATFFSPCATAQAALHYVGDVRPGETVAVTGAAGAVGRVVIQLAAAAGAKRIIGIERSEEGCARIVAPAEARFGAEALQGDEGVELLIDMAGGSQLPSLLQRMRPGGRAVLVGYAGGEEVTLDLPNFLAADVRLLPMNLIRWAPRLDGVASELLASVAAGEIDVETSVLPLSRLPEGLHALRCGAVSGRLAIHTDQSKEST